jgi:acetylornithine deacetylase
VIHSQSSLSTFGATLAYTPLEEKVLEGLDLEGMVSFLSELVSIPSLGGAESPAQERVAGWMRENGFEVDLWDLDMETLRQHPAYSAEVHRERGLGVVGVLGGEGAGRDLILNGHVDVVPTGDPQNWSIPPFEGRVEGGRVWGRGALDMKGGLVAALFAAKGIREAGVRLKGRLLLESVIGEEDGGMGTLAAILRGYRAHGAIIMEPTGLSICPVQAGALNFRITIQGLAAHGCIRNEGVSALEKLWPLHKELLALEARRNEIRTDPLFRAYPLPFPLSIGTVRGGDWASTVPDGVRIEGRYGLSPDEDVAQAQRDFEAAIERAAAGDPWLRDHPPRLEWWGGRFLPARTPLESGIVLTLSEVSSEVQGFPPEIEGVTFGSDLRHLVLEGGVPTVLFGPGDIRMAHADNESVAIEELEVAARVLTIMSLRFCGCEDD